MHAHSESARINMHGSPLPPPQFDTDSDGLLGSAEIASALRSHQVDITPEQVR